jgi:hypothetical protein
MTITRSEQERPTRAELDTAAFVSFDAFRKWDGKTDPGERCRAINGLTIEEPVAR